MSEINAWWHQEYDYIDRISKESKNSQLAWFELSKRYIALSLEEQREVDSILVEWLKSDDACRRSDAVWLIREHKIIASKKALEELCVRLKDCKIPDDPQGYHEREHVIEVLKKLGENQN